jgi:hypothetical protein
MTTSAHPAGILVNASRNRSRRHEEVSMLETKKQRLYALGAGAVAGVALMGGAAFAQTPGTSTPTPGAGAPSATATATPSQQDGGQAQPVQPGDQQDGKDCPHDQGQSGSQSQDQGSGSSGQSSYSQFSRSGSRA